MKLTKLLPFVFGLQDACMAEGSVPIRRNPFRRNPIRQNPNP